MLYPAMATPPFASFARRFAGLPLPLALAACVPSVAEQPAPAVTSNPIPADYGGLDGVIGRDASALERAWGRPDLDVREGTARKLQFSSNLCVLDAYLYPRGGKGEAVVTHIDARRPDGSDFDRASCVAALGTAR